ncbi:MAG: helix-turn-helix transcriptional regulator [Bradyrhizobium sp.]|uniref:S24 family peptidase n=1 Tax=Bradyrhizobium sp. TaxID=376 RepID=UPI0025BF9C26|nr:helix-turn-helix transcriptional regulator [Bradyrhizobium sp.]MBI5264519.1 helix-turn-helix transcriptional regulator [Bradyrhizobium sp.]
MLTNDQVWGALDRLAARAGLSPSGLARRAGLDPTTFNKSKRITPDGRARWPSTESIAKALTATGSSLDLFVELIGDGATQGEASVPLIGFGLAANGGYFDELGFPSGKGWNEVVLPWAEDGRVYALEISGDSMHPAYRDGDIIVVSPGTAIRRGDRVVVKTRTGEVMVKQFKRRTARTIELQPLNPVRAERTLAAAEVAWIARIIWASQ